MTAPAGDGLSRCEWGSGDPLLLDYHDRDWGVPVHDDRLLFEFLLLEGAQAGLSWLTILRRRDTYRAAFDGYDIERIAGYGEADVARLLADEGIIRNRAKVAAAIKTPPRPWRCSANSAHSTPSSGASSAASLAGTRSLRYRRCRPRRTSRRR